MLQVPKNGPGRGVTASTIVRVLFTIGQTLPSFPLLSVRQMGTNYSIWQFEMGILWMASAQNLALGPFLLD